MITDLIGSIGSIALAIRRQAQLAKANQAQCKRLADRIDILATAVKNLDKLPNPDRYLPALKALHLCLLECEKFIKEHSPQRGRFAQFKALVQARGIGQKFDELNDQMGKAVATLNLAGTGELMVNLGGLREMQEQNHKDAEEDSKKLDELVALAEKADVKLDIVATGVDELKAEQARAREAEELHYQHTKERQLASTALMHAFFNMHSPTAIAALGLGAVSPASPTSPVDASEGYCLAPPTAAAGEGLRAMLSLASPAGDAGYCLAPPSLAMARDMLTPASPTFASAVAPVAVKPINLGFKIPDGRSGGLIGISVNLETETVGGVRDRLAKIRNTVSTQITLKFQGTLLSDDGIFVRNLPGFSVEHDHMPGFDTSVNQALSAERTRFECTKVLAPLTAPGRQGLMPPPLAMLTASATSPGHGSVASLQMGGSR